MIAVVAGARPNFVKAAPILRELTRRGIDHGLWHTNQHDTTGPLDLCRELGMEPPSWQGDRYNRDDPRGYVEALTQDLVEAWALQRPRAVIVLGDVNGTLAAALAATAHGIPVVHVEAGLRSGDWKMPEERNRAIVDRISSLCLYTERNALFNLPLGVESTFVGNVMVDSLRWAEAQETRIGPGGRACAMVTTHRPSNVDTPQAWTRTNDAVTAIRDQGLDVLWVQHPRMPDPIPASERSGLNIPRGTLTLMKPQAYRHMVNFMKQATLVATDSGGVQEETTALGIPCLTLRENTERPITVTEGTNTVVGLDPARIAEEVRKILGGAGKRGKIPEGWDGHAAVRIVDAIQRRYL